MHDYEDMSSDESSRMVSSYICVCAYHSVLSQDRIFVCLKKIGLQKLKKVTELESYTSDAHR